MFMTICPYSYFVCDFPPLAFVSSRFVSFRLSIVSPTLISPFEYI